MDKTELYELLCDPVTKEPLKYMDDKLVSSATKFPIVKGVPVLLKDKDFRIQQIEVLNKEKYKVGFSWALKHWNDLGIDELLGKSESDTKRLLNFGSGSPKEKELMENLGYDVVSMDINAGYQGVDVIADGHHLPFKNQSFNTVTAFEVLEHLHEPWNAIKEINRVLSEGGRFVGSVAFLKEFHKSYFHMSYWGVTKLLEYGGFEVERIYGGQSVFNRLIGGLFPLGPKKISETLYLTFDRIIMSLRSFIWSTKHKTSAYKKLRRFDNRFEFSFREYNRLVYAPTVLFNARKIKNV